MRITWLFGASAAATALFGAGLLLMPEALLALYGLSVNADAAPVARVLGAQLLGYTVLEWLALRGEHGVRAATLRAVLPAEVLSFVAVLIAALQGTGNVMIWGLVAIFLVFSVWRAYYLWSSASA